MNWHAAHALLTSCGYKPGQGWDGTLQKFNQKNGGAGDTSAFGNAFAECIVFGDKNVKMYESSDIIASSMFNKIKNRSDYESSGLSSTIIYKLISQKNDLIKSSASFSTDEYACVCFFTKREQVQRESIVLDNNLPKPVVEFLGNYTRLYGEKFISYVACDVFLVDIKNSLVVSLVDVRRGFDLSKIDQVHSSVISKSISSNDEIKFKKINLFPAIDGIYKRDVGRVVELSFSVGSDSFKHELMRRSSDGDLRKEKYHVGGKSFLSSEIAPYKIAVEKDFVIGDKTKLISEMLIWGKTSSLSDGAVDNIYFSNVTRREHIVYFCMEICKSIDVDQTEKSILGFIANDFCVEDKLKSAFMILPPDESKFLTMTSIARLIGMSGPTPEMIAAVFSMARSGRESLLIEKFNLIREDGAITDVDRSEVLRGLDTGVYFDEISGNMELFPSDRVFPYYIVNKEKVLS